MLIEHTLTYSRISVLQIELENMASKMPGCHQGGFALYKLMLEATKNI
jgi:hypothetical protein